MRDKAVVSNIHQLTDKRVRLNPAPLPDDGATLDLDKWADKAVLAYRAAIEVYRIDYCDSLFEGHVDDARFSNFW